ncbi:TetR/AcrR family transcriptional regulator [Kineococcus rhizosphaerae]|uniref:TetR family transcriptional regulator n=1 Tax=Kineococcus rhizosphaerae TaxID=559628 RepID=A0A2T0R507_9ACTN|nr:TetR family transcriptional regulator [Kineococcus rhizosphaerae]PRY15839.1 TetR family transcriptional regulator [Kineococcus rhizosphaerae]
MAHPPSNPTSLVERKRRLVQQRIVDAADELFAEKGFENVSVTDIAARADVGRTTFFRYFGDKTEVVFAREREVLDAVAELLARGPGPARDATEAVERLRPVVLDVCARVTSDPHEHERHGRLLALHPELQARDALKAQQMADLLADALVREGTDEASAVLAAQVALACYRTGRRRAATAGALVEETRAAFEAALRLGRA